MEWQRTSSHVPTAIQHIHRVRIHKPSTGSASRMRYMVQKMPCSKGRSCSFMLFRSKMRKICCMQRRMRYVFRMKTGPADIAAKLWNPEALALQDPLTGLPNRLQMQEFMTGTLGATRLGLETIAVLSLDIDDFSKVNEAYGFAIGDQLLVEIARRLRQCIRDHDLLARVGVDEFILVTSGFEDRMALERLCTRIQAAIRAPFTLHQEEDAHGISLLPILIYPQASLGVALSPRDAVEPDALLECSDLALSRARQTGPGVTSFFSSDMAPVPTQRSLEGDLHHAITSDQFILMYQPRWNTKSGEMRGVEALIRWDHPTYGRLGPDDFIPQAERNGLIIPIGEWVLRKACETIVRLPRIHVSVNISAVQFRNENLVREVEAALTATSLPPQRLELEITESVLIENFEKARSVMEQLKKLGVRLAMDDFGTGYSSLGYLRSFPFDALKIDHRFIDDLDRGPNGIAIVEAILGLGQALGMQVVAEGVETHSQLAHLRNVACDEVQGFLLGSPMLIADLENFIASQPALPARPPEP